MMSAAEQLSVLLALPLFRFRPLLTRPGQQQQQQQQQQQVAAAAAAADNMRVPQRHAGGNCMRSLLSHTIIALEERVIRRPPKLSSSPQAEAEDRRLLHNLAQLPAVVELLMSAAGVRAAGCVLPFGAAAPAAAAGAGGCGGDRRQWRRRQRRS